MRLGATIPNFTAETTQGKIKFYDWLGDSITGTKKGKPPPVQLIGVPTQISPFPEIHQSNALSHATTNSGPTVMSEIWAVLFSHPADFTPVCTTELGRMAVHDHEFKKRGVKVIAHSCDKLKSHSDWVNDIKSYCMDIPGCLPLPDHRRRETRVGGST
ncbi:unnamed protein product [Timema podura]|uniref:Thioredoxin domain-containing protein n=1 Tax=Timema podura TaxID=61482 RepID=A0ABN7NLC2_TIMPD|nr:unnamed protein product [Timema podura]